MDTTQGMEILTQPEMRHLVTLKHAQPTEYLVPANIYDKLDKTIKIIKK
jgi:hypothetical protein